MRIIRILCRFPAMRRKFRQGMRLFTHVLAHASALKELLMQWIPAFVTGTLQIAAVCWMMTTMSTGTLCDQCRKRKEVSGSGRKQKNVSGL